VLDNVRYEKFCRRFSNKASRFPAVHGQGWRGVVDYDRAVVYWYSSITANETNRGCDENTTKNKIDVGSYYCSSFLFVGYCEFNDIRLTVYEKRILSESNKNRTEKT
jgi:hypothetical protein